MANGSHHVFGSCGVYVTLGPSLGGLNLFGVSTEGVTLDIEQFVDPIMDDRAGPRISTDEQFMGEEGTVVADIIWYVESIRSTLFAQAQSIGTQTEGTLGYAGPLFGLNSIYYGLILQPANNSSSPTNEDLWYFPKVRLADREEVKFGTVKNVWRCTWAIKNYLPPSAVVNTLNGSTLYKNTFP